MPGQVHGNPYDGHTLSDAIKQVSRLVKSPEHVFVDRGYRGYGYKGDVTVFIIWGKIFHTLNAF